MALQSSGPISLTQIQTEFGGSDPISLTEYYRGGAYTTDNNTGVPTSGAIDLADFYGAVKAFNHTITSNQQELNLATYLTNLGWDGTSPVTVTINSGVWIWSDNTSTAGLTISNAFSTPTLTIINNGKIIGKGGSAGDGGNGIGGDGGPAISNSSTNVTIINASGAYIAGGGGAGGGTHGGGGAGGGDSGNQSGGAIGQAGADASYSSSSGGGAGGGAGGYDQQGGAGGRILPGTGGTAGSSSGTSGGAGGSAGSAGSNSGTGTALYYIDSTEYRLAGSAGGGGWGASGGNAWNAYSSGSGDFTTFLGGAGGAAISGTAVTLTNNGTIYGSTA